MVVVANESQVGTTEEKSEQTKAALITLLLLPQSNAKNCCLMLRDTVRH